MICSHTQRWREVPRRHNETVGGQESADVEVTEGHLKSGLYLRQTWENGHWIDKLSKDN